MGKLDAVVHLKGTKLI